MNETINRHIQIGDWIFEIKMVRALRVPRYGEPYSAIANVCFNGNTAYIDGILQKSQPNQTSQASLSDDDIQTLKTLCDQMDIEQLQFEPKQNALSLQPPSAQQLSFA